MSLCPQSERPIQHQCCSIPSTIFWVGTPVETWIGWFHYGGVRLKSIYTQLPAYKGLRFNLIGLLYPGSRFLTLITIMFHFILNHFIFLYLIVESRVIA